MTTKEEVILGVEYEIEGLPYDYEDLRDQGVRIKDFNIEYDGTLRENGIEFVSKPLYRTKSLEAVEGLLEFIGDAYDNTHRCSQHIHVNLGGLVGWQKIALFMLLVSEEDFFFQYDQARKLNHYCTPLLYSPAYYHSLSRLSHSPNWDGVGRMLYSEPLELGFSGTMSTCSKYTCVNVMTAGEDGIGTLELRHFPPLMEIDKVERVYNKIQELVDLARTMPEGDREEMYTSLMRYAGSLPNGEPLRWCVAAAAQEEDRNEPTLMSQEEAISSLREILERSESMGLSSQTSWVVEASNE